MLPSVSLPKLDHILEPTSILIPTNLEIEPPIFDNYIPLMGEECDLNSLIWTQLLNQNWLLNLNLI